MSAPPALLEALRALEQVLDGEDLRWYVFGAQAVVVYGQPRLTADLDITVEASLERVLALIPALRERGFDPRSPEPGRAAAPGTGPAARPPAVRARRRPGGRHLDDVRGVLREQAGRLDLERSRTFLRLLEEALGRSDLVPVLERLVEPSWEPPGDR